MRYRFPTLCACCLVLWCVERTVSAASAVYYVAPGGSDTNAGTIAAPFGSLTKLASVMVPGDHAYVRGGTFRIGRHVEPPNGFEQLHYLNGTEALPIVIESYPGEKPVFDYTGSTYTGGANALSLIGSSHLRLKGLRFTGLAQMPTGPTANGLSIAQGTHNVVENIEVDHIGGFGFALGWGAHHNLFLNCDAHHLADPHSPNGAYGGANGFNMTGGIDATGNTFDGCRAWLNSDDGFDLFASDGFVTIRNCWSFWNGYVRRDNGSIEAVGDGMGFKLGPFSGQYPTTLKRVIVGNLAFENRRGGFDENGNDTGQGVFHIYNNTSYNNGSIGSVSYNSEATGFIAGKMFGVAHDVRNNLSVLDPVAQQGADWTGSGNSWNLGLPLSRSDFRSASTTGVDGPRKADGGLPDLPFLKPAALSPAIDRGTDVGLPYDGAAPDLGALEWTSSVQPTAPVIASAALIVAHLGRQYRYEPRATGSPVPTFSAQGLPSWLRLQDGVLGGIPTEVGATGPITIIASNRNAPDALQTFTITVSRQADAARKCGSGAGLAILASLALAALAARLA